MTARTPLQQAAKRLYDEFVCAEGLARDLRDLPGGFESGMRALRAIDSSYDGFILLMHEDDCS